MISQTAIETYNLTDSQIELCYHCHKCASGCPVIDEMQYGPDRILRMVALGQEDLVLASRDIWLCTGCFNCITHCPNNIDIAAVMDRLRQQALTKSIPVAESDILLFHRLFMGIVRRFGRSHEAFTLLLFKIFSHVPLLQDMDSGISLVIKGKIPLLPRRINNKSEIKEIFQRSD